MRSYLEILELGVDAAETVRLRLAAAAAAGAAGAHEKVIELAGAVLEAADVTTRADAGQAAALASMACRRRGDYVRDWTFLAPYAAEGALAGLPPLVVSRLVREIGAYYAETGRLDEAWQWQERSVGLAEDTGDPREIVRSINNFAITAGNRGHARIAITLFHLCVDLARQNHLVAEYALPLDNLIAYVMNRDLDAALAASEESMQVGESAGDTTGCWHTAANRAMLLTLAGRWTSATRCSTVRCCANVRPSRTRRRSARCSTRSWPRRATSRSTSPRWPGSAGTSTRCRSPPAPATTSPTAPCTPGSPATSPR